jgi:hypothetical protein
MSAKQRRELFDATRARHAVMDALESRGILGRSRILPKHVHLLDCTFLHGKAQAAWGERQHVGLHVPTAQQYLQTRRNKRAVVQLIQQFLELRLDDGLADIAVCAFHCNQGVHRSAAMSYLFGTFAECSSCFPPVKRVDLCSSLWEQHFCGGCRECDAANRTAARVQLEEVFIDLVNSHKFVDGG